MKSGGLGEGRAEVLPGCEWKGAWMRGRKEGGMPQGVARPVASGGRTNEGHQ